VHDEFTLLPRLVVALAIGAAIGWERQRYHKPAGLRTHALIAMACALLMALSELVRRGVPNTTGDPVRMAQAFRKAVEAGRDAREIGLAEARTTAAATSPLTAFFSEGAAAQEL